MTCLTIKWLVHFVLGAKLMLDAIMGKLTVKVLKLMISTKSAISWY